MPWAAAAAVAAAGISANASNKASKENARGIKTGLKQSADLAKSARADVISLFDNSAKKANIGIGQALDFYKQNAAKRLQPFVQGNQAAQNVISLGAQQANNAVLGLPVDMSFTNQPQVQADYGGIMGAKLPEAGPSFAQQQAPIDAANEAAAAADKAQHDANRAKGSEDKKSVKYRLDLKNQFKNQENDFKKVFGGLF